MTDGERYARLYDRRIVWLSSRLHHEGHARREDRRVEVVEPVDARAGDQAIHLREEDLVLDVAAPLGSVLRLRRERQVERVVAQVAAVGDDVLVLEGLDVRRLEVDRLGQEAEGDRLAARVHRQQVRRVAVQDVREEAGLEPLSA